MIKFYSPASIGNVGVGFDVLGAAIAPIDGSFLGDIVTISPSKTFQLINKGMFSNQLPIKTNNNIVWKCWKYFCSLLKKNLPITIILEKNLPIGSGLGSSACSVVASITAMNAHFENPIKKTELLLLMGKLEGKISGSIHYDNVAPCFLGGLQLIINKNNIICQKLPIFKNWLWIIAWPGIKIATSEARTMLPMQYSKEICIEHSRYLAGFVHALYTKQPSLASQLMNDVIAEPYRIKLLPNFLKIREETKKIGAIGCGISGSGPTIFVISDNLNTAKKIKTWLNKNYLQTKKGFIHICKIDTLGTRQIG
ncbi:serine kinase [Buchnera aphidicola (Schlechtendalia chinensis)]|uniref:Homoserine kinase n=1 Tax=Buchnera aphidicola subsp. Schlechtendalia chinensis TaxID=118110 RepID=A0A172WDH8_BUCSC|nr:homoserine kinase [Buchnera aphidicola]ANF16985.1 serine kinase [Buchnera aphidicola (Schlechtendalia chinensis)]